MEEKCYNININTNKRVNKYHDRMNRSYSSTVVNTRESKLDDVEMRAYQKYVDGVNDDEVNKYWYNILDRDVLSPGSDAHWRKNMSVGIYDSASSNNGPSFTTKNVNRSKHDFKFKNDIVRWYVDVIHKEHPVSMATYNLIMRDSRKSLVMSNQGINFITFDCRKNDNNGRKYAYGCESFETPYSMRNGLNDKYLRPYYDNLVMDLWDVVMSCNNFSRYPNNPYLLTVSYIVDCEQFSIIGSLIRLDRHVFQFETMLSRERCECYRQMRPSIDRAYRLERKLNHPTKDNVWSLFTEVLSRRHIMIDNKSMLNSEHVSAMILERIHKYLDDWRKFSMVGFMEPHKYGVSGYTDEQDELEFIHDLLENQNKIRECINLESNVFHARNPYFLEDTIVDRDYFDIKHGSQLKRFLRDDNSTDDGYALECKYDDESISGYMQSKGYYVHNYVGNELYLYYINGLMKDRERLRRIMSKNDDIVSLISRNVRMMMENDNIYIDMIRSIDKHSSDVKYTIMNKLDVSNRINDCKINGREIISRSLSS